MTSDSFLQFNCFNSIPARDARWCDRPWHGFKAQVEPESASFFLQVNCQWIILQNQARMIGRTLYNMSTTLAVYRQIAGCVHVSTKIKKSYVLSTYEYRIFILVCTKYVHYEMYLWKYEPVCTSLGHDSFSWYDEFTQWSNVTGYLSTVHKSISVSYISKNTVLTSGLIYFVCTLYVLSTYEVYTWHYWYEHVPNTLQSSLRLDPPCDADESPPHASSGHRP